MKSNNDSKQKKGINYKASAKLQIILMIIFFILFAWILDKPISRFKSDDTHPQLETVTPQKIIHFGGSPVPITVGMYIRDIPEFNVAQGYMVADIIVWFKFDPKVISLHRVKDFSLDQVKIKDKSKPYTWIEDDQLAVRYLIRGRFNLDMNYKNFPLDDHIISISLTNYQLSPADVIFNSSKFNLSMNPKVSFSGYKVVDKTVKTGYIADKIDPFIEKSEIFRPRVVFSFDVARIGIRHIISIILPLLFIFFLTLFSFTFDPFNSYGTIISMSIAGITAIIAQSFVVASLSPNPGYFMLVDKLFLTLLSCICIIFFVNVFGKKIRGFYKDILSILLTASIIGLFLYIVYPLF